MLAVHKLCTSFATSYTANGTLLVARNERKEKELKICEKINALKGLDKVFLIELGDSGHTIGTPY